MENEISNYSSTVWDCSELGISYSYMIAKSIHANETIIVIVKILK
jgi:hypothetical protein